VDLRRRGAEKFSLAGQMFFTAKGLEQATDEWVAAYKAVKFADGDRGVQADLCCGIGGDLLALAGRGPVVGVDRDPVAAAFTEANVAAWRVAGRATDRVEFHTGEVGCFDAREMSAWHLDPDRRPAGRRTIRVVAHDPPPEIIDRLLAECPDGAIKLAPAAELPDGWASRAELEWISRGRECRQLVAWFGAPAENSGRRKATILDSWRVARGAWRETKTLHDEPRTTYHSPRSVTGDLDVPLPLAPRVGRFVFEPDAAVLAAKLTGALAAEHGLSVVTPGIAYLTGDTAIDDAALACFEVLDQLPLRIETLKSWLKDRGIGRLEIKKRGVDTDPERLRRQLQVAGDDTATLIVTRIEGRRTVIAARRVHPS
jgi:THUMP domain-like